MKTRSGLLSVLGFQVVSVKENVRRKPHHDSPNSPIEFEHLGFKSRGSSGSVVMWVFFYMALVLSFKLL